MPTAVLSRVVQVSEQVSNKLREIVALGDVRAAWLGEGIAYESNKAASEEESRESPRTVR